MAQWWSDATPKLALKSGGFDRKKRGSFLPPPCDLRLSFMIKEQDADRRGYTEAENFLRNLDEDWARAVDLIGPCRHDPKAAREPYEALIRAIAYQQLTTKAGDAIVARLKALCPDDLFPTPDAVIAMEFDALRACGFSASKIATIKAIADGSKAGLVPSREIAVRMDDDALMSRISTIKGIGRWTVEMLLMYSLKRADILPADDFGVRGGYRALKRLSPASRSRRSGISGNGSRSRSASRMCASTICVIPSPRCWSAAAPRWK